MALPAELETDATLPRAQLSEEEASLWQAFKREGSRKARETLFDRHAVFAQSIARRLHREQSQGDLELSDLRQLAFAGLLEALDSFEPSYGTPFRAFAAHRVAGSVRDGIGRLSEVREQIAWRRRARRERLRSLAKGDGRGGLTSVERLAELAMGLALGFMLEDTGLFMQEERGASAATAYDSLAWKETVARMHEELSALSEREQTILRQHYIQGVGFEEVASLLGLSKGRISQIHRAALAVLRKRMREHNAVHMIG